MHFQTDCFVGKIIDLDLWLGRERESRGGMKMANKLIKILFILFIKKIVFKFKIKISIKRKEYLYFIKYNAPIIYLFEHFIYFFIYKK